MRLDIWTFEIIIKKVMDDMEKVGEKIVLKMIQIGTDKTNFKIIKMLPTNIDNIMKETGLTKVPVNVRVNKLEKVCLVKRRRGTGLVLLTDLGKDFIEMINIGEDIIIYKLKDMLM